MSQVDMVNKEFLGLGPEVSGLKKKLLETAGLVEKSVRLSGDLFLGKSVSEGLIKEIFQIEALVNSAHKDIDQECMRILAMAPVASDLRKIMAALKVNGDLERISDQSVNVAQNYDKLDGHMNASQAFQIRKMSEITNLMICSALDALGSGDVDKAKKVIEMDDSLDTLNSQAFRNAIDGIKEDSSQAELGITLILIARNFERIGDHATNISEEVIFTTTGEDIRHAGGN